MATTRVTQGIAQIMRSEVGKAHQTTTWFGNVIGRSQSHASQVLLGKKAMSIDELSLACDAFGLRLSAVMREAEELADDDGWHPISVADVI